MKSHTTSELLNDPVRDHIRSDVATLRPEWTVADSLNYMRANPPSGRIIYFYVTEESGLLRGVVPARRLLLSQPEQTIQSLMIANVITVPDAATVLEACEFFTLHRLLAFPVVDSERHLLGIIDVDLYTDELTAGDFDLPPGSNDAIFELIGVHVADSSQESVRSAFRGRFPWLLCNIGGGLAAAVLASIFQDVLTWKDAVLALFIPVVLALSESVAMQSLTLTVSRFRSQGVNPELAFRRGIKESLIGLLLGIGAALLVAMCAGAWLQDFTATAVLFLAIGLGVTVSAVIGFAVPTILHRLQWSPQVAAGPISLASADLFTLFGYFGIARLFA